MDGKIHWRNRLTWIQNGLQNETQAVNAAISDRQAQTIPTPVKLEAITNKYSSGVDTNFQFDRLFTQVLLVRREIHPIFVFTLFSDLAALSRHKVWHR